MWFSDKVALRNFRVNTVVMAILPQHAFFVGNYVNITTYATLGDLYQPVQLQVQRFKTVAEYCSFVLSCSEQVKVQHYEPCSVV